MGNQPLELYTPLFMEPMGIHLAAGQNQWYHFGVGAPPILVYFSWDDWDVHWGYRVLTHGQLYMPLFMEPMGIHLSPGGRLFNQNQARRVCF